MIKIFDDFKMSVNYCSHSQSREKSKSFMFSVSGHSKPGSKIIWIQPQPNKSTQQIQNTVEKLFPVPDPAACRASFSSKNTL